jgi:hypothetical protein
MLGGLAGGTAVLFDYSGGVLLMALFAYVLVKRWRERAGLPEVARHGVWYVLGSIPPVLLLWFYQWKSFGHPFYPGQHWMPPVEWIELGYQGYGPPQLELLVMLAFDHRFGLFPSAPLLVLALAAPFVRRSPRVPGLELTFLLGVFVALWVFFAGSNYTRLQFNTGIRYLTPLFPFLFVPAAMVLVRLPRWIAFQLGVLATAHGWVLAMHRDVEQGPGLLNPWLHVLLGGFELPMLDRLARMDAYAVFFEWGPSPLPLFVVAGAVIAALWASGLRRSGS